MNEVISIARGVTLACKNELVDICDISNFHQSWPQRENQAIRLPESPILIECGEQYECLQNPSIWLASLQTLKPTHIYSRIVIREKMTEIELQDALQYFANIYSVRSRIAGELATKMIFQSPQLQSLLMRIFEHKTWQDSIIVEALGVNAPSSTKRNKIKKTVGAVKPMSNKARWDRFARKAEAPFHDEIIHNLYSKEKINTFDNLITKGELQEALNRYQAFLRRR